MGRVEIPSIGTGLMDIREMFHEVLGHQYPFSIMIEVIVSPVKPERTKLTVVVYADTEPITYQEEGMIDEAIQRMLAKIDPCPECGGAGKLLIEPAKNVGTEDEIPAKYKPCKPCRGWGRRRERK